MARAWGRRGTGCYGYRVLYWGMEKIRNQRQWWMQDTVNIADATAPFTLTAFLQLEGTMGHIRNEGKRWQGHTSGYKGDHLPDPL